MLGVGEVGGEGARTDHPTVGPTTASQGQGAGGASHHGQCSPSCWPQVSLLMDHLEERRMAASWAAMEEALVRPLSLLRPDLGTQVVHGVDGDGSASAQDELASLLGVFATNCVSAGPGAVALFPTFSLLSHRSACSQPLDNQVPLHLSTSCRSRLN